MLLQRGCSRLCPLSREIPLDSVSKQLSPSGGEPVGVIGEGGDVLSQLSFRYDEMSAGTSTMKDSGTMGFSAPKLWRISLRYPKYLNVSISVREEAGILVVGIMLEHPRSRRVTKLRRESMESRSTCARWRRIEALLSDKVTGILYCGNKQWALVGESSGGDCFWRWSLGVVCVDDYSAGLGLLYS